MKRMSSQFLGLLFSAVVALAGCRKTPGFSLVGGGGSAASGGWSVSAGSIFLRPGEPGVLFGTQNTPAGERQFSYFVLFRHTVTGGGADVQRPGKPGVAFDGKVASIHDGIAIGEKAFELDMRLETDEATGTISPSELVIDGKEIDPAGGTVFLVDLASETVSYKQINAALPVGLPDLTETAAVMQLARQVTRRLMRENDAVRDFLGE